MDFENLEERRWLIATAAVVTQLCLGAAYAWVIFQIPLVQSLGWTEPVARTTIVIMMVSMGVGAFVGGSRADKGAVRRAATLGAILLGLGTLLTGFAATQGNLWVLYIGCGVLVGCGFGWSCVTSLGMLVRWFPDRRGLSMGLAFMGFGAGIALMGYYEPSMLTFFGGARTCFILGAAFLFLATGSARMFANPPADWLPKGFASTDARMTDVDSFRFSEAIRTPQWWMFWVMFFLSVMVGLGFVSQLSPFAQFALKKISPAITPEELVRQKSLIIGLASVFIALGPVLWAAISDHIGRRSVMITMFYVQSMFFLFYPYVSHLMQFAGIACFLFSCFGGSFAIIAAYAADCFGPGYIEKIYGTMLTAWGCAGVAAPVVFNLPVIKPLAFYLTSAILFLGFLIAIGCRPPKHKGPISVKGA
ncbi:MAG: OFA family MFS transporter [Deltaproteobacteria bacterium]|nr:OFA family MFS transporter [Deltaproteobacteria bacterium]